MMEGKGLEKGSTDWANRICVLVVAGDHGGRPTEILEHFEHKLVSAFVDTSTKLISRWIK